MRSDVSPLNEHGRVSTAMRMCRRSARPVPHDSGIQKAWSRPPGMAAEVAARPSAEPFAAVSAGVPARFSAESGRFDHNSTYLGRSWSQMSRSLGR